MLIILSTDIWSASHNYPPTMSLILVLPRNPDILADMYIEQLSCLVPVSSRFFSSDCSALCSLIVHVTLNRIIFCSAAQLTFVTITNFLIITRNPRNRFLTLVRNFHKIIFFSATFGFFLLHHLALLGPDCLKIFQMSGYFNKTD